MAVPRNRSKAERPPLTRERVLRAAIALADERGAEALTMRNVARDLGVEAQRMTAHSITPPARSRR